MIYVYFSCSEITQEEVEMIEESLKGLKYLREHYIRN